MSHKLLSRPLVLSSVLALCLVLAACSTTMPSPTAEPTAVPTFAPSIMPPTVVTTAVPPTAAPVQPTAVKVQPLAVPTSVSSQKTSQTNTEIAPSNNFPLVFVSTDTSSTITPSKSDQIFVYQMDPTSGELTQISKAGEPPNPEFIRVDPSGRYLIAVSEWGTDP
ncbi:MAG TPA: beta-propeller fold lactonase family protein, partial [Anaerolineaceae bacterium]|nr:beta-propeller fold lactonase family protein [Anaerolineaceae bacterium]